MSTTMTESNGTARVQRKQLSDQIDRLDRILDGLADALNGAVADAAREGSRAAVKEILVELLADPDVMALLQAKAAPQMPQAPDMPAAPTLFTKVCHFAGVAAIVVGNEVKTVARKVADVAKKVAVKAKSIAAEVFDAVKFAARAVVENCNVRRIAIISVGIGAAVAVLSQVNHSVASALSGAGAACTAAAVQAGFWLRSATKRFSFA